MDPHLILAYKLARLERRPITVFVATTLGADQLKRLFSPWRSWCRVEKHRVELPQAAAIWCEVYGVTLLRTVIGTVGQKPALVLEANFDDLSELDVALLQEVAHHDFEIGGKNEWDGSPVRHSHHILRLLSATHCVDFFPILAEPFLARMRHDRGTALRALDVGCGPVTWLRHGSMSGALTVTGVDPLLDVYEIVLQRHGLSPLDALLPETRLSFGIESLPERRPGLRSHFDFVWTNNALDHTSDPWSAVAAMAFALRHDGCAVIQVATNEGTRRGWSQLHKFDVDYDGRNLIATDSGGNVAPLVGERCPLDIEQVLEHGPEGLTVVAVPAGRASRLD